MAKMKKTTAKKAPKAAKPKKGKRETRLTQITYSVSPELEAVIGTKKASRPEIVKKLWAYIKKNGLQDAKKRRMINPDDKLSKVLGSRPIDMLKMAGAISKHID